MTLLRLQKNKHSKAIFLLCSILLTVSFKLTCTVDSAQVRPNLALTCSFVLKEGVVYDIFIQLFL